ncbi:MAG: Maf family protein [Gammaproteobacteria bacterium]|jgi:septum formation protein
MTLPIEIYLASTSPRRRQLLQQIGVCFQQLPIDVHEAVEPSESPEDYVRRVALDKARTGWDAPERRHELPVLGADTEVVLDGQVLGKPRDRSHGLELLRRLAGRSHQVLSAVAVVRGARREVGLSVSTVQFRQLTDADCRRYWATGEPADKAGAYAIQGRGAVFVRHLEGSYSGVMGLPLYETAVLLGRFGVDVVK